MLTKRSLFVQKCSIDRPTVHRSISSYRTVDRWPIFIGLISNVILTSECQGVLYILRLDGRINWKILKK